MLQAELKMGGISNVGIHNLSPGMVTTELLLSGAALGRLLQPLSHAITSSASYECSVLQCSPPASSPGTARPSHSLLLPLSSCPLALGRRLASQHS